ncbi:hypothetical protein CDL15_Pgr024366 [Punica granatum]|uniref:Uncharacterized protein n=1 Tax=Punica granatum TaxID=22663 RepID=A0A218XXX1_PUNGR|nr:hypothetical protein CDL15_Pgr024366 [Punica granatum]PKI47241.1 hypothetical protein CRG98_032378 [Punica granatum]
MALQQISRLCDEVEELGSIYLKASEEMENLKDTKRQVKGELKKARDELEDLKTSNASSANLPVTSLSDRKLMKADMKTAISELEHQLGLLEAGLVQLEKKKERVFGRREDLKVRMVRKVVEVHSGKEGQPVSITGARDVTMVGKMIEWVPVEPRACRVSVPVSRQEVEEIREEAERLNIKVEFPEGLAGGNRSKAK